MGPENIWELEGDLRWDRSLQRQGLGEQKGTWRGAADRARVLLG